MHPNTKAVFKPITGLLKNQCGKLLESETFFVVETRKPQQRFHPYPSVMGCQSHLL